MRLVSLLLFLIFTLLPFTAGHIPPGLLEGRSREQKVWVREGSSAVLPCHLGPRKTRESSKQLPDKISVLWKRHGGSVHQEPHVVLEVGYSGLQKTAQLMKPRVSLQDSALRNGNFSLRIVPVRGEDAGLYEAQVKYRTEVHSCLVELGVITVTLSPPSPVIESEMLSMSCNSSHRASLVETCWFHKEHLGPTSRTFCSLSGTLSILHPAMSDAGSWRCQLRYSDKEIISATFNLQILGFDGPSSPVVYAAAGSAADLPCSLSYLPRALGMRVVAAHWSHLAGGHLEDRGISQNLSSRSFPLHVPVVGPGDAGQYRCAVSVGHRTISRDVTLAVLTVTPSIQGPVSEGARLLLICSLTHAQGHERFQWTHLDSAPTKSKLALATPRSLESHSSRVGPTLEIPQVSRKDTGNWECSVHGPEGRLGAVEYDLQITGAQVSSAPSIFSGQITFGLTLTLFFLLAICVVALALQKRAQAPAFPALEGMFAASVPWKPMEEKQKGKKQQTEC
ncbi:lymphocyte activation gene 3 protein [Ammospiza nelsoni]|uniref:lymphocyte activation gene 3 protein n=1 Tax=Ammospiza caudacuta TaxID=2857398 RepID=UPI00273A1737|nr:lymphocyte activation gene 3 protein [Ammospiza caudacuta]XP_059322909.1 lymphocyte activation gene 3 protein [Ammospiza nelsoni]